MTEVVEETSRGGTISPEGQPRNGPPRGDFGMFIANRRRGWAVRIIQGAFTAVFGLMGLLFAVPAVASAIRFEWDGALVFGLFSVVPLGLAYFFARHVHVSIDLYERGLVWKSPIRRGELAYKDLVRLDYGIVRQYVNGLYTGTLVTIGLFAVDGRKFKWVGRYKETPKGWAFTSFGRTFEVTDRFDFARELIAIHVADVLESELASKGKVAWTKGATITPNGIIPAYGRRKGSTIRWEEIHSVAERDGHLMVFDGESRERAFGIPCAGANYFPGLELVARVSRAAGREVVSETGEPVVTRKGLM